MTRHWKIITLLLPLAVVLLVFGYTNTPRSTANRHEEQFIARIVVENKDRFPLMPWNQSNGCNHSENPKACAAFEARLRRESAKDIQQTLKYWKKDSDSRLPQKKM